MFRTIDDFARMLKSRNADTRLRRLFKMREQITGQPPKGYFSLAKRLIGDSDNDCRWQSLIVIGEYVQSNPQDVWRIILKHGESDDEDMRMGVATCLLEHLLEYYFSEFFPRVMKEAIRSPLFADTLSRCGAFGQAKRNWRKAERVLQGVRL